jgi:hypothetical protein
MVTEQTTVTARLSIGFMGWCVENWMLSGVFGHERK